jgi:anti-sigma B factor antagonist
MLTPNWLTVSVTAGADGARVVQLSGELDMATAPQLTEVLTATIESGAATDVDIDLDGLSFLDAAGLNAILHAHRLARRCGRTLRTRTPHGEVYAVLRLTETADLLHVEDISSTGQDRRRSLGTTPRYLRDEYELFDELARLVRR